jgi:hypothetical protein
MPNTRHRERGHEDREHENAEVHRDGFDPRDSTRIEAREQLDTTERESYAECAAGQGQRHALGEHLCCDPTAAGSEGRSERQLA